MQKGGNSAFAKFLSEHHVDHPFPASTPPPARHLPAWAHLYPSQVAEAYKEKLAALADVLFTLWQSS